MKGTDNMRWCILAVFIVVVLGACYGQVKDAPETRTGTVTLTGILIVSDHRCDELRANHLLPKKRQPWECPEGVSQWGLLSGSDRYSIFGDVAELGKYERSTVTLTGAISGSSIVVDSIAHSEIAEVDIQSLIGQLRLYRWNRPTSFNPQFWEPNFTKPMLSILQSGGAAQDVLLQYLDDPQIKDQIIILLGGVGDEKSVGPIIRAMTGPESASEEDAKEINFIANLALTNITQSEAIWHHGGGMLLPPKPGEEKDRWTAWWAKNAGTFKVSTESGNRNYTNYPNYGIYRQP